jgi:hypothetical protein
MILTSSRGRRIGALALAVPAVAVLGVSSASGVIGARSMTAQAALPTCRTSNLTLWRGAPSDHAAGHTFFDLEFSNTSSHACTLTGHPRVRALDAKGNILGPRTAFDFKFAATTVTLRPKSTAHALLILTSVAAFSPTRCKPTAAAAIRIWPPNTIHPADVPLAFEACANPNGPTYLAVRVIRPFAGIPGYSQ